MAGAKGIYGLSGSGLDVESLVKVGMISQQKNTTAFIKRKSRRSGARKRTRTSTTRPIRSKAACRTIV